MQLLRSLRRRFRGRHIDADARFATDAEAKRLAYDRDSIRLSQDVGVPYGAGGSMTPTPDVLHPHQDDR
jgi:hypothetical protein